MWIRLCNCEHHQSLINIGNCRTNQLIHARKYGNNISSLLALIQNFYLNIISYQRFNLIFWKSSFGFTFINTGFYSVYVVESGNSFYYISLLLYTIWF